MLRPWSATPLLTTLFHISPHVLQIQTVEFHAGPCNHDNVPQSYVFLCAGTRRCTVTLCPIVCKCNFYSCHLRLGQFPLPNFRQCLRQPPFLLNCQTMSLCCGVSMFDGLKRDFLHLYLTPPCNCVQEPQRTVAYDSTWRAPQEWLLRRSLVSWYKATQMLAMGLDWSDFSMPGAMALRTHRRGGLASWVRQWPGHSGITWCWAVWWVNLLPTRGEISIAANYRTLMPFSWILNTFSLSTIFLHYGATGDRAQSSAVINTVLVNE